MHRHVAPPGIKTCSCFKWIEPKTQNEQQGPLSHLHLAVNHSLVLALAIHVMDLRVETAIRERRIEHVIREDGHEVDDALAPRGAEGVRRVIGGRPRVRAVGHASIRELVEHALVGVGFGAEEDEVLEAVGQSVVGVVPRRRRPPPPLLLRAPRAAAARPPPPVGLGREDDVEGAYRLVGRDDESAEGGGGRAVRRYRAGGVTALLLRIATEDAEGGRGRHPPIRAALRTRLGRNVDGGRRRRRRRGGGRGGVFHRRRRGMMIRRRGRRCRLRCDE